VPDKIELPVPVLKSPHWRVRFIPDVYQKELVPSLRECLLLIEQTKLSIRGWDYPHLSRRESERQIGSSWIASWSDYAGHNEYWRFYQSSQFIHLFSIHEDANPEWKEQLRSTAKAHLTWGNDKGRDWSQVPGFIHIPNFLYTVTEVFEFAARLCEKGVYRRQLSISIGLSKINGFILAHNWDRAWMNRYEATEVNLTNEWRVTPEELLSRNKEHALTAVLWFFERFGWLNPSKEILTRDQDNFINRRF
jgi:hypothetical protein